MSKNLMPNILEIRLSDLKKAIEQHSQERSYLILSSPVLEIEHIVLKYIYVSGPYSLGNINQNVRMAIYTGDELARRGYIPFIPHLSHLIAPHDYQFWLDQDLQWLERCDCVFRLPGESAGADVEVARAVELGLPVFYSWAELERYTNG